ncbi:MAG: hypothetical protein HC783_14630 [Rhodobacteraceae bacterium]|nr:hypothetical protein [Paracoccaceae bacterium]
MLSDPALADLRALLGDRLSLSTAVLAEHATSESLVTAGLPDAVAFPRTTAEVAALAAWSSALIARSGFPASRHALADSV